MAKKKQHSRRTEMDRFGREIRAFDTNAVERAAWGWDRHEARGLNAFHDAERVALAFVEKSDLGEAWDEYRRTLFGMTESPESLVAWQAKHGARGHKAENAAFGAALALFARDGLSNEQYAELAAPMAEVLPWLLPEQKPGTRPA